MPERKERSHVEAQQIVVRDLWETLENLSKPVAAARGSQLSIPSSI